MDGSAIAIVSVVIGTILGAIVTPFIDWLKDCFNEPKIVTSLEYRKHDEQVFDMRPQHLVLTISNNGKTSTRNLEMALSSDMDLMTDHMFIGTLHPQYTHELTIGNLSFNDPNTICFSLSPPDSPGMRIATVVSKMPMTLTISFFDDDHAAWSFYYGLSSVDNIRLLGTTRKLKPLKK